MLETGQTGVRKHIDVAKQLMAMDSQVRRDLTESLEDGLNRKPDWASLKRVQSWLSEP
jgi:hypothetical protein